MSLPEIFEHFQGLGYGVWDLADEVLVLLAVDGEELVHVVGQERDAPVDRVTQDTLQTGGSGVAPNLGLVLDYAQAGVDDKPE